MSADSTAKSADAFANKYCRSDDLSNEASVEQFFVARLLVDLGYDDREIKPKTALAELLVGKGRKKEPYKPDFLVYGGRIPRWIIDAKATTENPDDFVDQGAGYCLGRPLRNWVAWGRWM
jgi:type I restriction enzyme M protein